MPCGGRLLYRRICIYRCGGCRFGGICPPLMWFSVFPFVGTHSRLSTRAGERPCSRCKRCCCSTCRPCRRCGRCTSWRRFSPYPARVKWLWCWFAAVSLICRSCTSSRSYSLHHIPSLSTFRIAARLSSSFQTNIR